VKKVLLYLNILALCGIWSCEFDFPTLPKLPGKWDSKVIIPALNQSYSVSDLIYNSSKNFGNPIFADTSGNLFHFAVDSFPNAISMADSFWTLPSSEDSSAIEMSKHVRINPNQSIKTFQFSIRHKTDDSKALIKTGLIDNQSGADVNRLFLSVSLSDTFPNDVRVIVACRNFENAADGTMLRDTLTLAVDSLFQETEIDVSSDSLVRISNHSTIDSLQFDVTVEVQGTLIVPVSSLSQHLSVKIGISPIHLDNFYGTVFATGQHATQLFYNSPAGAEDIIFDSTSVRLIIDDPRNDFTQIQTTITGEKFGEPDSSLDSVFTLSADTFYVQISDVISNLPDSVRFRVKASLPNGWFNAGQVLNQNILVKYEISAPLIFTLPPVVFLAAADPTTFFITDSSTRSNITKAQNGAEMDIFIENRSPFHGNLFILIGNFPFFPTDSTQTKAGFSWENNSWFHFGTDTQIVMVDTLAAMGFTEATYKDGELVRAGKSSQVYLSSPTAIALMEDSCYIEPIFQFINSESVKTGLKNNQSIHLKTYLNLLFDPVAISRSWKDTANTE